MTHPSRLCSVRWAGRSVLDDSSVGPAGATIGTILPPGIESHELFEHALDEVLFPEEEAVIGRAVESRRREFTTVRRCARVCLARLGHDRVPILPSRAGAPLWPPGVVGSMTHCGGYSAAAVGPAGSISVIGIDAEPDAPLPEGVLRLVTTAEERKNLAKLPTAGPGPCWDRALFSAKEAVYKAWFPAVGDWLDFHDAEITFGVEDGAFTAELRRAGLVLDGHPVTRLHGRWTTVRGIVLTAVAELRPVALRPGTAEASRTQKPQGV